MTETLVTAQLTGHYQIDPTHTRLGFIARHAMITKVRGQFTDFEGSFDLNAEEAAASRAIVRIRTGSITTQNEQRDGHLMSPDFLNTATYPEMAFVSAAVKATGVNEYELSGDLTIKDITRPVAVSLVFTGHARDPYGNFRAGFEGKAEISRRDWGLTWNTPLDTGGVMVGDKVQLEFDTSAIKTDEG